MKKYALVLGDKNFQLSEDSMRRIARSSIVATKPTKIITDYAEGWNSLVLDEASKLGVPYMGVLPYESENSNFYTLSKSTTNIIFHKDKESFLENPFPYLNWLKEHVDEVLCYINPNHHNYGKNILKALKNKTIRNLFHQ